MHRTYGCSSNPHRSRPLCDFCGKKFCQPQKLKVHIKRMHSDFSEVLKEFQCKSCLKILGSRAALQRHLKEVHQKQIEDAYSCSRCGKKFQNKSNLKIHMLTHSGVKPFRCSADHCNAAFTTKQCLQFHYKKVHHFTEQNMPTIERSIDYTFQAYSGNGEEQNTSNHSSKKSSTSGGETSEESDNDNSVESPDNNVNTDTSSIRKPTLPLNSKSPSNYDLSNVNMKVLSKGSKKWIAEDPTDSESLNMYGTEKFSKDKLSDLSLQNTEVYNKERHISNNEFSRQETSNASLLVEAALDSVCSETNIEIDVATPPNCGESLANNLYTLTATEALSDVTYAACINESRDINLISPLANNQTSINDEINNDLRHTIRTEYPTFQHSFHLSTRPESPRLGFTRHYINNMPPHVITYEEKTLTPISSSPRYDFNHTEHTEHDSSEDGNDVAAQNLSLHNSKSDLQLDLSQYKSEYKSLNSTRRLKCGVNDNHLSQNYSDELDEDNVSNTTKSKQENKETSDSQMRSKYFNVLSANIHDIQENGIDDENTTERNITGDTGDIEFKPKEYNLVDIVENRKQYENVDSELRIDRNFEPIGLNSSELQGLDMSARSFHNYSNLNRYHLYSEVDRVDLRFTYSPPAPSYTHSDILRVVSLDLTPPGRHSVELGLRGHPLHQIANSRILAEHGLQNNAHRLLDQSRLLGTDLNSTRYMPTESRLISDNSGRILSEHTTRMLTTNDQLTSNHILNSEPNRLISDNSRIFTNSTHMLEQGRLVESKILTSTPNETVPSVQAFNTYSVSQTPFHPTPRQPMSSPTSYHHYSSYY